MVDHNGDTASVKTGVMTFELSPRQMAEALWSMHSEAQAEMLHELHQLSGGDHYLMMQFMCTRDKCEERQQLDPNDGALAAFQSLFASAYKWMAR